MTSRLILTLVALLTLAACASDLPTPEPGIAVSGAAKIGVVVGDAPANEVAN